MSPAKDGEAVNLIEAIKSGKSFRRRSKGGNWFVSRPVNTYNEAEILADDWEIKEPTVTITSRQFWDAVRLVAERFHTVEGIESFVDPKILASKLGLEAE